MLRTARSGAAPTALTWPRSRLARRVPRGVPAALLLPNLPLLRRPAAGRVTGVRKRISVLIPARDEEHNIGAALDSVLAEADEGVEVVVLDDASSDATAAIVAAYATRDARVRLLRGEPLEPGVWGKPVACARLAEAAHGDELVFMDADVRLESGALRRLSAALERSGAALLSGVPRQITLDTGERLIVPLIHFVLLGFLPLSAMRRSKHPGFGVACGQLLIVTRDAYFAAGGHRAVADKIHDGMALARAMRRAGSKRISQTSRTSHAAACIARGARCAVGFAKNAHEGLGSPRGIVPWTVLLARRADGVVLLLPFVPSACRCCRSRWRPVYRSARERCWPLRFVQPMPACAASARRRALVAIQWWALARRLRGRPVAWKRRTVSEATSAQRVAPATSGGVSQMAAR